MDLNQLKSAVALLEALQTPTPQPVADGRKVIVRSRDAGVIYGEYAGNDGSTVHLRNAVQMWKWFAAKGISLIDVATFGVKKSDCKFSTATATVTVFNACALIDVTADAAASIEAV
jgi:LPS sulfotransferase NodH